MRGSALAIRIAIATVILAALIFGTYEVLESPGNQLFGKTLVRGPSDERVVALTYDDGPNPPYTDRILDVLRKEHVHATFFVVGRAVAAYPNVVREEMNDGTRSGITRGITRTWCSTINPACATRWSGPTTRSLPPPGAARTSCARRTAAGTGSCWTKCANLGTPRLCGPSRSRTTGSIRRRRSSPSACCVTPATVRSSTLHDGNQGLLCDTAHLAPHVCDRGADVEATRLIVEALKRQGYRFVTIPELLRLDRPVTRTVSRAGV